MIQDLTETSHLDNATSHRLSTTIILVVLLVLRIATAVIALIGYHFVDKGLLPSWVWLRTAGPWINSGYTSGTVISAVVLIRMYRNRLDALHMDGPFIVLFAYSGIAVFLNDTFGLGCLAGIATILFVLYALSSREQKFSKMQPAAYKISLVVGSILAVCIIILGTTADPAARQGLPSLFLETFPGSVLEEVIYRGLLWMVLRNWGLSEPRTWLLTSALFWVSHINYVLDPPFNFWMFIPAVSLLLGYIILRSKSLTASALTHVLANVLYGTVSHYW